MLAAVVAVVLLIAIGVYVASVMDVVVRRRVAGDHALAGAASAPVRSAALLLRQRVTSTERPDRATWLLAPAILFGLALTMMGAVPLGPAWSAADTPHGILLFGAAAALVIVPVFLQGWSPNSVFPLIGAYRMLAQGLSYMIPLALSLIAAVLPAESLSIGDIVRDQQPLWNVIRMPLGLPVYLAAVAGLAFYGPLALPSAPQLAGGIEMEASGIDLLWWRVAQRAVLVAASAVGVSVFLGGWAGPVLPGIVWLAVKTFAVVAIFVVVRHRIPRLRPEQFVTLGWVVLLPLSLVNIFVTGWWLL